MAKSSKKTKKQVAKKVKKAPGILTYLPTNYKLIFAIIFGLAVICYANTLMNGYAIDDSVTNKDNKFVEKGFAGIGDILGNDTFIGKFGKKANILSGSRYRPLSVVTFAIENQFLGYSPGFSHFLNMVLYGLNGILIYLILCRLLVKYPAERWYLSIPFISTVLYMVHPLHTEAVANIKGRDEIMVFMGSLLALYYTIRYLDTKQAKYLGYTFIAFFLGLMSKENAVTFLAVIPLTIYFFTEYDLKKNLVAFAPMLGAGILFMGVRAAAVGRPSGQMLENLINDPFLGATFMEKYATIFHTFGVYLKLLFVPHPLTFDYYPYHIPIVSWGLSSIVPLLIYVGAGLYALWGLRTKSLVAYAILFYLLTFSIVSNFFVNIGVFMSERFLYIPSLGFCLIIAYLLTEKLPKLIKNEKTHAALVAGFVGVVSVLFIGKSITRNFDWKDDMTLIRKDVQVSSNSAKSNYALGTLILQEALENKDLPKTEQTAKYEEAIPYLKKAIEVYPGYDQAHSKLADVYYYKGDPKNSILANVERLRNRPNNENTVKNIIALLQQQKDGNFQKKVFEDLKSIAPTSFSVFYMYGRMLFDSNRDLQNARTYIQKANQLNEQNKASTSYSTNKALLKNYLGR